MRASLSLAGRRLCRAEQGDLRAGEACQPPLMHDTRVIFVRILAG